MKFLLIDADDTLWENNIYFERAFDDFCEFLAHSTLTSFQVREALNEIETVNAQIHGYGSRNFGRNLQQAYERLAEREIALLLHGHSLRSERAVDLAEQLRAHHQVADDRGDHDRERHGGGGHPGQSFAKRH